MGIFRKAEKKLEGLVEGGFGRAFYDAYQTAAPLPAGHGVRAELYNLYHVLNHANLFGGGYARQARASIDRLLAEVRG